MSYVTNLSIRFTLNNERAIVRAYSSLPFVVEVRTSPRLTGFPSLEHGNIHNTSGTVSVVDSGTPAETMVNIDNTNDNLIIVIPILDGNRQDGSNYQPDARVCFPVIDS
jgi:hypothetical protein